MSGIIWLCKNCEETGKTLITEGPDIYKVGNRLKAIQNQLIDQQINEKIQSSLEKAIDERMDKIERSIEEKINLVTEDQKTQRD